MAILAVNLAVAVWVWVVSARSDATETEILLRFGALERGLVGAGQWWRLFAAGFLHAGVAHLAANMVFGIPWCRQLEQLLGHARFAGLYLASLLGASSLSLLGAAHVSVGASGALFGVIGAALAIHRRAQGSWGAFLRSAAARTVLLNLAILAAIGLVLPIDQLAHGGGLVTGAAMGWLWTRPPPRRAAPWIAFALALLALACAALWLCREDRARTEAESTAAEAAYSAMPESDLPRARATEACRARDALSPAE